MKFCFCYTFGFLVAITAQNASASDTLTLEQAWVSAYVNNPSLEAQRAKLRASDEDVAQALSNWRPKIEATSNIGKTYGLQKTKKVGASSSMKK